MGGTFLTSEATDMATVEGKISKICCSLKEQTCEKVFQLR